MVAVVGAGRARAGGTGLVDGDQPRHAPRPSAKLRATRCCGWSPWSRDDSAFVTISTPGWVDVVDQRAEHRCSSCSCCSPPSAPRAAGELLGEEDEERLRALLDKHGERDSLGYFALRRDKSVHLVADRQGGGRLPGAGRGVAGLRRSDRRPGGVARRDRARGWREAGRHAWVPGGDGRERGGRHRLRPARPGRAGTRRRGHRRDRRVHPGRAGDAHGPAGVQPGQAGRLHRARSGGTPTSRRTRWPRWCDAPTTGATGRPSAASRWRSGGSATRPTGDCVMVECADGDGRAAGAAELRAVGAARAVARPDAA